jgi:hypothetical protein
MTTIPLPSESAAAPACQEFAQLHECADHKDAHLDDAAEQNAFRVIPPDALCSGAMSLGGAKKTSDRAASIARITLILLARLDRFDPPTP